MQTRETLASVARYCPDLGLWALDRPVSSCRHFSPFCRENCYNEKLYNVFGPSLRPKDRRNEAAWTSLTAETVSDLFNKLERSPRFQRSRRLRLMTRGEALATTVDVSRVVLLCSEAERRNATIWLPTRVWRNRSLWAIVQSNLQPFVQSGALKLMASTDPSDPIGPADGTSTMYFGDDTETAGRVLCAKTHEHVKAACQTCERGCFSTTAVDVHLKKH